MLTDKEVKAAKPGERIRKLTDGRGVQLWVRPNGSKYWRFDYRFNGKRKLLALGVYPRMSLKEARDAANNARELLDKGDDPSAARKLAKAARGGASANNFDAIAAELLAKKRLEGKTEVTLSKIAWLYSLARPSIGVRPIAEITAAEVLTLVRKFEARGTYETARRLRANIGAVFRFAIATSRAESDPTYALKGALIAPKVKHRAAIIEPKAFGGLLRAIAAYEGLTETKSALELLTLTFVRPGELRTAEWNEFDFDKGVWEIPAAKMKMRRPHKVPLAPQSIEILKSLEPQTGRSKFLFPSLRTLDRPISENTLNAALRRLGFSGDEMTSHGFRAAASSILNESGLWNPDAIEAQLAHAESDAVRKAYARAEYWDERSRMMTWWADKVDEMREAV